MRENETLSPKQTRAIEALLAGKNVTKAAAHADVSRRTLHRWMQKKAFQKRLRAAQDASIAELTRSMTPLAKTALDALEEAMSDDNTPSYVKIRAALGVLGQHRQIQESYYLTERVAQLERELDGNDDDDFEEEDDDVEPETED
jgi:uncharacterized protein (UPF0147 family)